MAYHSCSLKIALSPLFLSLFTPSVINKDVKKGFPSIFYVESVSGDGFKNHVELSAKCGNETSRKVQFISTPSVRFVNTSTLLRRIDVVPGHNVDVLRKFRSEEHTSELQSLMRISYAVFCLKKKNS